MDPQTRERVAWTSRAKCVDMPPHLFDAETLAYVYHPADRPAAARALCAGCPVIRECAADSIDPLAVGVVRAGLLLGPNHTGAPGRETRAALTAIALGPAHG